MAGDITLRDVTPDDLPIFFEQQQDLEANWMAAFTAKDPTDHIAFMAHWAKILGDPTTLNKTICADDQVVGHIAKFEIFGETEVSYWIGKAWWGKGVATRALTLFLQIVSERPLHARAVKDNLGSIRVLEKCGFVKIGEDRGFAEARGMEVEEYLLMLSAAEGTIPGRREEPIPSRLGSPPFPKGKGAYIFFWFRFLLGMPGAVALE